MQILPTLSIKSSTYHALNGKYGGRFHAFRGNCGDWIWRKAAHFASFIANIWMRHCPVRTQSLDAPLFRTSTVSGNRVVLYLCMTYRVNYQAAKSHCVARFTVAEQSFSLVIYGLHDEDKDAPFCINSLPDHIILHLHSLVNRNYSLCTYYSLM